MADIKFNSNGLMNPIDQKAIEEFMSRFTEAVESPDEDSMEVFFASQENYLKNEATSNQLLYLSLILKELGVLSDADVSKFASRNFDEM
jgi:hypothetical protein